VSKENWEGGHNFPNTCDVMLEGNQLTITRTDSNHPWGLDLQFTCHIECTCPSPKTAREKCDDPKCPVNLQDPGGCPGGVDLADLRVAADGELCAEESTVVVAFEDPLEDVRARVDVIVRDVQTTPDDIHCNDPWNKFHICAC
jgi:hypothetical protein